MKIGGDVLVIPVGQPHTVEWKRPAGIVSLKVSESFVRQATGSDQVRFSDTFAPSAIPL
jgi:hypothetical protein